MFHIQNYSAFQYLFKWSVLWNAQAKALSLYYVRKTFKLFFLAEVLHVKAIFTDNETEKNLIFGR